MAVSLKHKFANPKSDTPDTTVARASNWNDEHDLTLAANRVLGRKTAGTGSVEELTGADVRAIADVEQAGVVAGINTRTSSYTLALSDRGKVIEMDVATANTVTVPNEAGLSGVDFPIGTRIVVVQKGTGATTLIPAPGVTVLTSATELGTTSRYSSLVLYKRAANEWVMEKPIDYEAAAAESAAAALASEINAANSAASALDSATNAAASAGFRDFSTLASLQANTTLTYSGATANTVTVGQIIRVRDINATYQVVASGASTWHVANANATPVRMVVVPGLGGVNIKAFGAVGDGVTDDTAKFKLVEAISTARTVDLAGGTYSIVSIWTSAVNGVRLTKNYKNGILLVDGRRLVFDRDAGLAAAGAFFHSPPTSSAKMGLTKRDNNTYFVWQPLGGRYWATYQVSRDSSGVPFNWRETYLRQVLGIIAARDGSTHTYTGSWATDTATTALTTADETAYISGRAQQAITVGDYVEVTYNGGGDLFVIFTGRTNGNYVNVLLNGSQKYLILPDDGAGNKYFDSYTSTDLSNRQIVQIASGVPSGDHTVRLTVSSSKNAAVPPASADRYVHNALAFLSSDLGPWSAEADAPEWVASKAILDRQVCKWQGQYYYANGSGTTGSTAPTHTSGSASDGGVTWVWRAAGGYELPSHRIHAVGSQLEYAYEIKPTGATSKQDVGGSLHGNETQTAFQWRVGGSAVGLLNYDWAVGDSVSVRETINATHTQIGGGSTAVNKTVLQRVFDRNGVIVRHSHVLQMAAEIGYFYPAMWPLLHYSSIGAKYGVTEIWSPGDGVRRPADFYGITDPFVGTTKDYVMEARGPAFQPDGVAGVPTAQAAPLRFRASVRITPDTVDSYEPLGSFYASKAMNTSGADVSSGGYSSMTSKIYFERNGGSTPQAYASGSKINCQAIYRITLEPAE